MEVKKKFRTSYENQRCLSAAEYEQKNRNGLANVSTPLDDLLLEAQRTGEIFPGRPEVRPSIDFSSTSKDENLRSSQKPYAASTTHSPGIFTV